MRLTDVLGDCRQLEAFGRHGQANGRRVASLPDESNTVDRCAQLIARDGQLVRVTARDELLVVREVTFDQARRDGRTPDTEHDLALRQDDLDLLLSEEPLDLAQPLTRYQHLLAFRQHAHALEITHREAVRVGRDQAQTTGRRGQ